MKLKSPKIFVITGVCLGIILTLAILLVMPSIVSNGPARSTFKSIYLRCDEDSVLCNRLRTRIANEVNAEIVSNKKDAQLVVIIDEYESTIKPMIFTGTGPSPFYEYGYQITAHFYTRNGEHISDQIFTSSSDIVATDYLHDYTIKYGYYQTYNSESETWADVYNGITYDFCQELYSLYEFVHRKRIPYATLYLECSKSDVCTAFESIVSTQKLATIVKDKDAAEAIITINNEQQSIENLESNKFNYNYTVKAKITDKNGKQIGSTISANSSLTINTNPDYEFSNNTISYFGEFGYSTWSFIHSSAASILVNKIINTHSMMESGS